MLDDVLGGVHQLVDREHIDAHLLHEQRILVDLPGLRVGLVFEDVDDIVGFDLRFGLSFLLGPSHRGQLL